MKPRERVLAALSHQPVDRIPIDLGGTPNSTMCIGAYERLKAFLGVEAPTRELSKSFETAYMDEAVLRRLPVDTRAIYARSPASGCTRWLDERTYVDEWGITYHQPANWRQYDIVAHPLAEATLADLERYPWPDVDDETRYAGLGDEARALREGTDFAICGCTLNTSIFDRCWMLRGMEQFMIDLLSDRPFATALLQKVAAVQYRRHERFLAEVGPYLDVIMIADDMGTQKGPLIRPETYRELVKPIHRGYVQVIKRLSPARVLMHSCGSIVDLVEDYIDIGIDALNPMQVAAAGMAPLTLRQRFKGRMAFWGGIDTQRLLPRGTPEEVRQAVRDMLDIMGLEGGYVLGAVHNIQDDVPPENVWAMLDEAASITR